jgi:hypothetical protein
MRARTPTPNTLRIAALAILALIFPLTIGACTIQPDSSPRDISADRRDLLVGDAAAETESAGNARIYLVAPSEPGQQRQLRAVQRNVTAEPKGLIEVLLGGPNQTELDNRFVSILPTGTELLSARRSGPNLFIDLSNDITELTGEALTLAVAQLVFTGSEIPGVQYVTLRVEGQDQAWPRGDGQSRFGELRVYDYPGFVETSQPPFPAIPNRA